MIDSIRLDRAIGTVVASAAGDALGAPYEFGPALPDSFTPTFGTGLFGHAPAEWTDDTSMAIVLLDELAAGQDLLDQAAQVAIVKRWIEWSRTSKDVGAQTRSVFATLPRPFDADSITRTSRRHHETHGRSAGNGSLMRTGPLALGYLESRPADLARAAGVIARLTHWEQDNADACALWCLAIRHAILTGELDVTGALPQLPPARRERWRAVVDEALAPGAHPRDFQSKNGWVVRAFQGALAAVAGSTSLTDAIQRAIRGGGDTDTVAAIAGALAGSLHGVSAVPLDWQRRLHGWPRYRAQDLVRQAALAARRGSPDAQGWPTAARMPVYPQSDSLSRHPHDDGVWIGSLAALDRLPTEVDAVVSLCRVGSAQVPSDRESVQVWLIDQDGKNPNLDFVLTEAADMVAALRGEGKTVFLHCAEGRSRTAAVAALHGARDRGIDLKRAWGDVRKALPGFAPQPFLQEAVERVVTESR